MSWLIPKNSSPGAAAAYRHGPHHEQELVAGFESVPESWKADRFDLLVDFGAGDGAGGDAALASGLLLSGARCVAVDHHAGFHKAAFMRGRDFLHPEHLRTVDLDGFGRILIVASHVVNQAITTEEFSHLDASLDLLVEFVERAVEGGATVVVATLEPGASSARRAGHLPWLIEQRGLLFRSHRSRPTNHTPERGFPRVAKSFAWTEFVPPTDLLRLPNPTVLGPATYELDFGFGEVNFGRIEVPVYSQTTRGSNLHWDKEAFVRLADVEVIMEHLRSRRDEVAWQNLMNSEMIGLSSWD